ncbi:helix-turn-helix domain-containing protein [Flavobacterium yafengii]|uniref:helix-turn-helix domain-containing protein n=1 Tax=Flavobacterium yafengii TaxID=3041253 RepID=UPI0024A830D1|nr:helix-turn-helix domain-containing protein [Flavobacterium yafengii]MDI5898398.1 helix-turn-helix domain-containing protein [Flavobacterium yafengii]
MEAQILFQGCTFNELANSIAGILQSQTLQQTQTQESDLVSRDEVCKILHFNKTTLHKHTKSGRLKSYSIGNRVLYKRSEVLEAVTPLKQKSRV